jgi:hypothetical protein
VNKAVSLLYSDVRAAFRSMMRFLVGVAGMVGEECRVSDKDFWVRGGSVPNLMMPKRGDV